MFTRRQRLLTLLLLAAPRAAWADEVTVALSGTGDLDCYDSSWSFVEVQTLSVDESWTYSDEDHAGSWSSGDLAQETWYTSAGSFTNFSHVTSNMVQGGSGTTPTLFGQWGSNTFAATGSVLSTLATLPTAGTADVNHIMVGSGALTCYRTDWVDGLDGFTATVTAAGTDTDGDGLDDSLDACPEQSVAGETDTDTDGCIDDVVGHWTFESGVEVVDVSGHFGDLTLTGTSVSDGALPVTGTSSGSTGWAVSGAYAGPDLTTKTLVSWVRLDSLETASGSALTLDAVASDQFDGIVYAELAPYSWLAGSNNWTRSTSLDIRAEDDLDVIQMAIIYDDTGSSITICRNGVEVGSYSATLATFADGDAEAVFGARHNWIGYGGAVGGMNAHIEEARIYATALTCGAGILSLEDADGDSIPDVDDACLAEDASGNDLDADGCIDVDTDGDGLVDPADECPTEDATDYDADADGCLDDTDGDGVTDDADLCPTVDATGYDVIADGCLDDTDGDGVTDDADQCDLEDAYGYDADADGCLDDGDGDGVTDDVDLCPSETTGLLDSDADGCVDTESLGSTSLDPRNTYLRRTLGGDTTPLALSTHDLCAGDELTVTATGAFRYSSSSLTSSATIAVFSGSSTLASSSTRYRVTDAVDAGDDIVTATTSGLPTDIDEDFYVSATGTELLVPEGATHLFVAAHDSSYGDNSDTDGDYGYTLAVRRLGDMDGDTTCSDADNCPDDANADQADSDGDGLGDACDACPSQTGSGLDADADGCIDDSDGDGVLDSADVCPTESGSAEDADGDGCFDDADADGVADSADVCSGDDTVDSDGDGTPDDCDGAAGTTVTLDGTVGAICYDASGASYLDTLGLTGEISYSVDDGLLYAVTSGTARTTYWDAAFNWTVGATTTSGMTEGSYDGANFWGNSDSGQSARLADVGMLLAFSLTNPGDPDAEPTAGTFSADFWGLEANAVNDLGDDCYVYSDTYGEPHLTVVITNGDTDTDGDGVADVDDVCPSDADDDLDADGLCADVDACPEEDATGLDSDGDGCLDDSDGDGVNDLEDACPSDSGNDADEDGECSSDGDCDDADATVNTLATEETGDGVDSDCDDSELCYVDEDGDGVRTDDTVFSVDTSCGDAGEALASAPADDCDDTDALTYPGADEIVGDGVDEDCDGYEYCYVDYDGDGYVYDSSVETWSDDEDCSDATEALATASTGDCDDSDALTNPGAPEVDADGIDEDCNGTEACYADADLDGYRGEVLASTTDLECDDAGNALESDDDGDCDDTDASFNPGATETVGDEVDSDCDGGELCFADADGDHHRGTDSVVSSDSTCTGSGEASLAVASGDCDDTDAAVNPDAAEVCDGVDDDCSGDLDLAATCADECGDGSVATSIPTYTVVTCPSPTAVTTIRTLSQLQAWAANPTRTGNIAAAIDLGGADLTVATACDVKSTTAGSLSNAGDVVLVGRNVLLNAPLSATGEVMLRASTKVLLGSGATVSTASFSAESAAVDLRADNSTGGGLCIEGGSVATNAASSWDLGGADALFSATTTANVYGDLDNGAVVELVSDGRVYHRADSTISDVDAVRFDAGTVADLAGQISGAGSVTVDAATLNFSEAAAWDDAGTVDFTTSLSTTNLQLRGDVTNSGAVSVSTPSLILFGSNSWLYGNDSVLLTTSGRFDGGGDITGNGDVEIVSGSWIVRSTHDFSGNVDCTISGSRVRASAPLVGCTPL